MPTLSVDSVALEACFFVVFLSELAYNLLWFFHVALSVECEDVCLCFSVPFTLR